MDIFNAFPTEMLCRVCTAYANLIAGNDLAVFDEWTRAEWALAPQTAFVLGVGALIHAQYQNAPQWLTLPAPFRVALARQYSLNKERTLRIRAESELVLRALIDFPVPVMPLKGLALSKGYYPDPFTRPMADLDMLVRAADLMQVSTTLQALGYIQENHATKSNFVRTDNRYATCFDADHPDNPRRIEIHTQLQDEFRSSTIDWTEWAWLTSIAGRDGTTRRELTPAVLFAHLLSHTSRDIMTCRVRLIQLYDIALVARRLTIESGWANFQVSFDAMTMRFLYPALALARRYFESDIPDVFYQKVTAATPLRLQSWCDHQTLWDVSWLSGNHIGVFKTVFLWAQSTNETMRMFHTMWKRRSLHLAHLFPHLQQPGRAWLAYPAYVWDQMRGGHQGKRRRGRWDYSNPASEQHKTE